MPQNEEVKPSFHETQKESQGKDRRSELKAEIDNNDIKDTVTVARVTE